jgi:hypothetical protein
MILKKIRSGRCEATPTLFRPFSPMNSGFGIQHRLRRCALFFRQEAGSHQMQFSLLDLSEGQKEFLLWKYFCYTNYVEIHYQLVGGNGYFSFLTNVRIST